MDLALHISQIQDVLTWKIKHWHMVSMDNQAMQPLLWL